MGWAMRWQAGLLGAAALGLLWPGAGARAQGASSPSAQVAAAPAQTAQAPAPAKPLHILDEVKVGALVHDIGLFGHRRESGADVNLELLFVSPDIFRYILRPRPVFGADINSNGDTSNYYAGLAWGGTFYKPGWNRDDGFFGYFTFGPSVNDGKISTNDPHRKSLGSHVLFREGGDLGYQITARVSVAAFIDHISNAGLANRNEGITNGGVRFGYKF